MLCGMPLEPTTPADRTRLAARFRSLLAQTRSGCTAGLSDGERLVLTALLDPDAITVEVYAAVAPTIWGAAAAAADAEAGYPRTWAWLVEVARG